MEWAWVQTTRCFVSKSTNHKTKLILGMMQIRRPWKISSFQDAPTPSFIYVQKSSNPLILDVQFQMKSSSPNGNQSIQIKDNPRMALIFYQVLPSAFVFSINSLISSRFHLTFLHLAEASLSAFSWPYTLVSEAVQKYHEMYFTYNYF